MITVNRLIAAMVLMLGASALLAATPPPLLPPGIGRYIMVVHEPGDRGAPKTIKTPDVAKLGGTVISQYQNEIVIDLPLAAAKALRADGNVAYLQRVWMGEPFDTWKEEGGLPKASESLKPIDTSDLSWTTGTFGYDPSGNIRQMGNDSYAYDLVSRVTDASVNGVEETYAYDGFGNLTAKTISGQASTIPAIDSSSNRILGEVYDAAGNLTTQGGVPRYWYDADNMMTGSSTSFGQKRMIYTADDERIGVQRTFDTIEWTIRDFNTGQVLRGFQQNRMGSWIWQEDYVYAEGKVVGAEREYYYGGRRHLHLDHLGSVRMITDDTSSRLRYARDDYLPFGLEQTSSVQEVTNFGFDRNEPMRYTGHERDPLNANNIDTTDYLDYMHARYYSPVLGRFLSVDPTFDLSRTLSNPQAWNRYTYVLNNPVNLRDPGGECPETFVWIGGLGLCWSYDLINMATGNRLPTGDPPTISTEEYSRREFATGHDYPLEEDYATELAIMAPFTGVIMRAGVSSAGPASSASVWEDITTGRSVPNRATNVTAQQAGENLEANGFARSVSQDGKVSIFQKGEMKYTIRATSKSTGGPTMEVFKNGQLVQKIRLGASRGYSFVEGRLVKVEEVKQK